MTMSSSNVFFIIMDDRNVHEVTALDIKGGIIDKEEAKVLGHGVCSQCCFRCK